MSVLLRIVAAMKTALFAAITLVVSLLTLGLVSPAHADPVPTIAKEYARQMKCRYPESSGLSGGGPNDGVECRVISSRGRHSFYILKYKDPFRAMDYWREWLAPYDETDDPGYFVRKGKIFIIPAGGGSGEDDDWYTMKWATYAAAKLDGRVVAGYPY